jgi:hypothetical protein
MRARTASVATAVLGLLGVAATSLAATPSAPQAPQPSPPVPIVSSPGPGQGLDPRDFTTNIDNPWFPLRPGQTYVYTGRKDGKASVDTFEVSHDTAIIDGVPCVVVHDTLTQGGAVVEKTLDWYSEDWSGNVWYFGEDTQTLDRGGRVTSTEGTWQAGVDGATPGIFMPMNPQVGQSFQQEHLAGRAEDWFVVLQTSIPVTVPFGEFTGALLTAEWSPLEPAVLSEKVYVPLIGEVREADVAGGRERFELRSIRQSVGPPA